MAMATLPSYRLYITWGLKRKELRYTEEGRKQLQEYTSKYIKMCHFLFYQLSITNPDISGPRSTAKSSWKSCKALCPIVSYRQEENNRTRMLNHASVATSVGCMSRNVINKKIRGVIKIGGMVNVCLRHTCTCGSRVELRIRLASSSQNRAAASGELSLLDFTSSNRAVTCDT